ncbi:hypothetical protein [Neisseria wadsworthii]|uniref:Uncharacterized protein n=1 Tax=Neisseria wadsworthii 9715 TaxID=1030841 RepID=G4CMA9_9NEIS|nr:hypothetical protein [Neisseria wadsworthii]EGZ51189.1 hypothetical protein HMPREF9370_0218 [Neisseria wadsworthii 9715]QMT36268.1 hypothetical protein H3L96_03265 [Neisseria wadsworthii]
MTYIEYESKHDPLDNRRLARSRFAAYCLPAALAALLLNRFVPWFLDVFGSVGSNQTHLGKAGVAFAFFSCVLIYYQNKQLDKRCNDAGRGWTVCRRVYQLGMGSAVLSAVIPLLMPFALLAMLVQFVYGLALPANSEPNLSGYPNKPADTPVLLAAAAAVSIYVFILLGFLYYL